MRKIEFIPIKSYKIVEKNDNIIYNIINSLNYNNQTLYDKDIIVISSKVLSLTQGNVINLDDVIVKDRARNLAKKYNMDSRLTQLIVDNFDKIIGGVKGVLLTIVNNMFIANGGIDQSNSKGENNVILWPNNPYDSANEIRIELIEKYNLSNLGIIISDSHISPLKQGVVGSAIGISGISPVENCIGRWDLFNRKMEYTKRAIADQISSGAHLVMGECDERVPYVIVRNINKGFINNKVDKNSQFMEFNKCLFMNSLKEYFNKKL